MSTLLNQSRHRDRRQSWHWQGDRSPAGPGRSDRVRNRQVERGSGPDRRRVTAIQCDHRVDDQVEGVFRRILDDTGGIDILVNNVWGGYERMIDNGVFTWGKPFWEQPLSRWDAMFSAGVRAHYHASQLVAPAWSLAVAV